MVEVTVADDVGDRVGTGVIVAPDALALDVSSYVSDEENDGDGEGDGVGDGDGLAVLEPLEDWDSSAVSLADNE